MPRTCPSCATPRADHAGVRLDTRPGMNRRSPCRVTAQRRNPETTRVRVFETHDIWYDPTRGIDRGEFAVCLDRRSLKRYYVDLSFLPEAAD